MHVKKNIIDAKINWKDTLKKQFSYTENQYLKKKDNA